MIETFQQGDLIMSISRLLISLLFNGFALITIFDLLKNYLMLAAFGVIILGIFA